MRWCRGLFLYLVRQRGHRWVAPRQANDVTIVPSANARATSTCSDCTRRVGASSAADTSSTVVDCPTGPSNCGRGATTPVVPVMGTSKH